MEQKLYIYKQSSRFEVISYQEVAYLLTPALLAQAAGSVKAWQLAGEAF